MLEVDALPDGEEAAAVYYPLRNGYRITWRQDADLTWTAIGTHETHHTITKHASTKQLAIDLVKDEIDELLKLTRHAGS